MHPPRLARGQRRTGKAESLLPFRRWGTPESQHRLELVLLPAGPPRLEFGAARRTWLRVHFLTRLILLELLLLELLLLGLLRLMLSGCQAIRSSALGGPRMSGCGPRPSFVVARGAGVGLTPCVLAPPVTVARPLGPRDVGKRALARYSGRVKRFVGLRASTHGRHGFNTSSVGGKPLGK